MNVFSPVFDAVCENILHAFRHKDSIIATFKTDRERKKLSGEQAVKIVESKEEKTVSETEPEEPVEIVEEIDLSEKEYSGKEAVK